MASPRKTYRLQVAEGTEGDGRGGLDREPAGDRDGDLDPELPGLVEDRREFDVLELDMGRDRPREANAALQSPPHA